MNNDLSRSYLDIDLSFTSFSVQDLDTFLNSESLELLKSSSKWIQEISRWISFIQSNKEINCPEIVRSASKLSLGLELTNDKKISELNHAWLGQSKSTDVLSFPIIDEKSVVAFSGWVELGDIVISVPTAIRQSKENNVELFRELKWLATHGLLHLLGWDHFDDKSLTQS
tara:strand:- start:334 stop:843 length:510 start_codon:yes stop_codon:yes gene_type:complete